MKGSDFEEFSLPVVAAFLSYFPIYVNNRIQKDASADRYECVGVLCLQHHQTEVGENLLNAVPF